MSRKSKWATKLQLVWQQAKAVGEHRVVARTAYKGQGNENPISSTSLFPIFAGFALSTIFSSCLSTRFRSVGEELQHMPTAKPLHYHGL